LGTPSKRSIILLHAVLDCPGGRTAAIARRVRFAKITNRKLLTATHV